MCIRYLQWGGEFMYFMVSDKMLDVISASICVNLMISKSGSNIRAGSPGNFEAELRLPRQN